VLDSADAIRRLGSATASGDPGPGVPRWTAGSRAHAVGGRSQGRSRPVLHHRHRARPRQSLTGCHRSPGWCPWLGARSLAERASHRGRPTSAGAVHARCSGYVDRRLRGAGWETAREVAIVDGRWRGWIDLLAFDTRTGTLLVIEIKTMIDGLGALERQIGWYERVARRVSMDRGWRPRRIVTWLLVLASEQNELAMMSNRDVFDRAFGVDVASMQAVLDDPAANWPRGRALAVIDPGRRRRTWLVRPRIRGGRSASPYRGYRDAASSLAVTNARQVFKGAP
jgi:hypothetical protein